MSNWISNRNSSRGRVISVLSAALALIVIAGFITSAAILEASPTNRYEQVWEKVNDHFLWSDRLSDWDTREEPPRQFQDLEDAEKAIDEMLDSLGDKYTYYYTKSAKQKKEKRRAATGVVSSRMLPGDIGYIRITTFSSRNTATEVEDALKSLSGAKAYVIDLRDNGGGLVWQSFRVFALFADQGVYQTARGRWEGKAWTGSYELTSTELIEYENGKVEDDKARPTNLAGDKPLTILVDGDTASASEALAGALRHHRNATLVGTTTFGKGIMQTTFDLSGGSAVKVTYAYIYQPDGSCVHTVGLKPDQTVQKGSGSTSSDPQLDRAVEVLEQQLDQN